MIRLPTPDESARRDLSEQVDKNGRLSCPYCGQLATPEAVYGATARQVEARDRVLGVIYRYPVYTLSVAVCAGCGNQSVFVRQWSVRRTGAGDSEEETAWHKRLHPLGRATKIFSHTNEVHLKPYRAACSTLEISPEASACMSRRCLQGILRERGYTQKDLVRQIEALLAETEPKKGLPADLHQCVDAIRNFGNFGAHPINDLTTLQIIDVEPGEAEWCIEIAEQLMEHYFERPKKLAAKITEADAKLKSAGKPGIKR
jgi:hypothetical protein